MSNVIYLEVSEINAVTKDYGFIITDKFDFVLIGENRKGKLISQEKLNQNFKSVDEIWIFITNEGLLNIPSLLMNTL
jgi:hypothetical protein